MDILRPYILVSTRYPSFHAPDNHFTFPLPPKLQQNFPYSLITPHGFWPLYRQPHDVTTDIQHFTGTITLAHPLITVAAKLLYLSRREVQPIQVPPSLSLDRAAAIAQGNTGVIPTQADIHEFNRYQGSQFVEKGNWDEWKQYLTPAELQAEESRKWTPSLKSISSKYDPDWTRLMSCSDPWQSSPFKRAVHVYGTMEGLWHGRMLMPDEGSYLRIASNASFPSDFGEHFPFVTTVPVMVRLREHHCIRPMQIVDVPLGEGATEAERLLDEGVRNGWLPDWVKLRETGVKIQNLVYIAHAHHHLQDKLIIQDQHGRQTSKYDTYRPGQPNSHSEETCEICLAKTWAGEEAILDRIHERRMCEELMDAEDYGDDSSMDVDGDAETDSEEEDELRDIPDEFIESVCTGISDIIITGEVSPSIPYSLSLTIYSDIASSRSSLAAL